MKVGARMAAAAQVLSEILDRHLPAAMALSDWGRRHRFAGSGDRSAIGNLVYDALRRRHSVAAQMGDDTARALAIGAAPEAFGLSVAEIIAEANSAGPHTIGPLSEPEIEGLSKAPGDDLPAHVRGDFPQVWQDSLVRTFGGRLAEEMAAFAERAPVGLRANQLKVDREKVIRALAKFSPVPARFAPDGIIVPHPPGSRRTPHVEQDPAHGKGWFEVQDEGSQIVAALSGAEPRLQVLDLCAGAGGKSLALGALMRNTGQIYAYDRDPAQLRPIFERLKRAGVRNVQTIDPGNEAALLAFEGRFDIVFVDAPCSGSGTWRRRPDAKWRLSAENFAMRQADQRAVLSLARTLVKPGGRLVYVTCSVLPEENVDQVTWFLSEAPEFVLRAYPDLWRQTIGGEVPASADGREDTLLLTPASHGTDGFFFAAFEKSVDNR
ncbi:MAG: RsmB/NOP family class I SAM-dependent RNA methyltransferase [Alphaproteobacteria bacterium]|nr:RsmB/NOP family class I SAM-dependent RNA methyltransferase [Alphaproteobacteria bacterium]